jgi:cobalt-zinc-cadmium efflux system protein
VYRNIRQSLHIILQGSPAAVDMDEVKRSIVKTDAVRSVHDLHAWSVDGQYNVLTIHVVLHRAQPMVELRLLKAEIRETLLKLGVQHSTIEFEIPDEDCDMEGCC